MRVLKVKRIFRASYKTVLYRLVESGRETRCREEGWTCVTNDGALRRLCKLHDVKTRFGLRLMVDLVAGDPGA